ncbi:MAG TPA: exodeoxyribonuclease III [Thermoanaerobaculia bacterium]|jgi:exodeoxyribonuclease-3
MKVVTWNVNGVRARELQVVEWLEREKPDVLCLQELKAAPDQMPLSLAAPEGYATYWHGHKGYSGVGLLLKTDTFHDTILFSHPDFDHETRIVEAATPRFSVASVYVPNGGKDFAAKLAFLEAMGRWAREARTAGKVLLVCGDLNVALTDKDVHPKERKAGAIGQRPDERALLANLLDQGLVDTGRALDPGNENLFTYWAPWRQLKERNIGWRIDFILASESLAKTALASRVHREFGTSDHGPVVVEFS